MQGKEKEQFGLFGTTPLEDVLPEDHPLRKIRAMFDEVWAGLAPSIASRYSSVGVTSVPPAVLFRAFLLRALYSIKSERALCEQIAMNAGFRWFVGLDWDDRVFDHSTLSRSRERLFGEGSAEELLGEVCRLAEKRGLLSSDRLVVDGTLVKAWASHKSFRPKDEDEPPKRGGISKFKGMKRSNRTHESRTDPDARLIRKSGGAEAILCHLGSIIVDSVSGMVKACKASLACGLELNAEVKSALELALHHIKPGQILAADRGYDCRAFTHGLRQLGIKAHPRRKSKDSSIDGRTTGTASYEESMKRRFFVEGANSWIKDEGRMSQTKLRGTKKVDWELHLFSCALNLRKMALKGG